MTQVRLVDQNDIAIADAASVPAVGATRAVSVDGQTLTLVCTRVQSTRKDAKLVNVIAEWASVPQV